MSGAGEAPLPTAALLLAVLEDLGIPDDGDGVAVVAQRERLLPEDVLAVVEGDGEHDGHGLVRHALVQQSVVVKALQKFSLPHETWDVQYVQADTLGCSPGFVDIKGEDAF